MSDGPLNAGPQVRAASQPPEVHDDMPLQEAAEVIREWFLQNFENPAEHTPYESAEGGYQYIWGGPYETRDILEGAFTVPLSDELIEELVSSLEYETDVWVINQSRIEAPDDDEYDFGILDPAPSAENLHAEMLRQAEAVERTLREVDAQYRGIGHNNPPEAIHAPPLTATDREEMGRALALLKSQPVMPELGAFISIEAALSGLRTLAAKVGAWGATKADVAATKFAEELGKRAAQGVAALPIWLVLGDQLQALIAAAGKWLMVVNPPF